MLIDLIEICTPQTIWLERNEYNAIFSNIVHQLLFAVLTANFIRCVAAGFLNIKQVNEIKYEDGCEVA